MPRLLATAMQPFVGSGVKVCFEKILTMPVSTISVGKGPQPD